MEVAQSTVAAQGMEVDASIPIKATSGPRSRQMLPQQTQTQPQSQPQPQPGPLACPTFSAIARRGQTDKASGSVFRTVNVQVPQYKHVTRVGLVRSLSSKVLLSKTEAVMRQPTGWQVTMTDLKEVRGLVGDLEVEGRKCEVSPVAEKNERGEVAWVQPYVMVRVHWLPYFLDMEVLKDSLGLHGKIISISDKRGLDGIPNGVRRVRMEIKDMSLFPHMLRCWFGGEDRYRFNNCPREGAALPPLQAGGACQGYVSVE